VARSSEFELGVKAMLVTFDQHYIGAMHVPEELLKRRLRRIEKLADMSPAARRRHYDFDCPRGTMLMTVLARMINIEFVMGVLYGRDLQPPGSEFANQVDYQRRFTRILEAGNSKNFHVCSFSLIAGSDSIYPTL
jgi:hypothetical protein